jgi:hypothetical protein
MLTRQFASFRHEAQTSKQQSFETKLDFKNPEDENPENIAAKTELLKDVFGTVLNGGAHWSQRAGVYFEGDLLNPPPSLTDSNTQVKINAHNLWFMRQTKLTIEVTDKDGKHELSAHSNNHDLMGLEKNTEGLTPAKDPKPTPF